MKIIAFLWYYVRKRLGVLFGIYKTVNPLDIRWRWNYWHARHARRRQQISAK